MSSSAMSYSTAAMMATDQVSDPQSCQLTPISAKGGKRQESCVLS
eukprot:CAMPEP_0206136500 /NCGR_PEP_ID=MMETSP1473-20131121/1741_1 /ASSEMBLY_ACC=CAM_ASM_001109 /TAXON_ID=1461547 /ORGANISM="Stichococcus sp, Strain RCC1054" /LENGTH=44 /DNA_ID= /DNA_START= /DNA_END= /DNA_ORIENTATION=